MHKKNILEPFIITVRQTQPGHPMFFKQITTQAQNKRIRVWQSAVQYCDWSADEENPILLFWACPVIGQKNVWWPRLSLFHCKCYWRKLPYVKKGTNDIPCKLLCTSLRQTLHASFRGSIICLTKISYLVYNWKFTIMSYECIQTLSLISFCQKYGADIKLET